jgi:hypothetical protein
MNYHYIEFMIKERRKEEVERCNRMRLLKLAGYPHKGFKERMFVAISQKLSFWKNSGRLLADHSLDFSLIEFPSQTKGGKAHELD